MAPRPGTRSGALRTLSFVSLWILLLAACTSGPSGQVDSPPSTDAPGEQAVTGGTVTVAIEKEPASLNPWSTQGATPETADVVGPVLGQLLAFRPDMSYEPQLLESEPEVVSTEPMRVRYRIRAEAAWEDGSPVTAADVQYTLTQVLAEQNDIAERAPYQFIRDGALQDISADQKEFTLEFSQPYGAYRDLFASPTQPVLKASGMAGRDFNLALVDFLPFSSGPFRFDSWRKGQEIVLVRNENYWGPHKAYLDKIVFRFVEAPDLMVQAMSTGEVQVASQVRQPAIAEAMSKLPNVDVQVTQGPLREQIDFDVRNVTVGVAEVRLAVAYALDRRQLIDQSVSRYDRNARVLQNAIFVANQPGYEEHWNVYEPARNQVDDTLGKAGYVKGADGYYEKGGQKLKLTLSTTAGNAERETLAKLIKDQLGAFGIDIAIDAVPAADLFGRLSNCEYQIALYATRARPDPGVSAAQFSNSQISCPGQRQNPDGRNSTGFDDAEVSQLIVLADAEPEQDKRNNLYNQVDTLLVPQVPTLPLFQRATALGFYRQIHNVVDNATIQGPTWNAAEWWIEVS